MARQEGSLLPVEDVFTSRIHRVIPLYDLTKIGAATLDKTHQKLWLEANEGDLYCYDLVSRKLTQHFYNLKKDAYPNCFATR
jgi:hypothetical protein